MRSNRISIFALIVITFPLTSCMPQSNTSARKKYNSVIQSELNDELKFLLSKIDIELYEQSEADIRAWLDTRIKEYKDFGIYPYLQGWPFQRKGDRFLLSLKPGGYADSAAQFFRAYEMLGDKKYLDAGLRTVEFYLKVQQPQGHFPMQAYIFRDGRVIAGGDLYTPGVARIQDGYQFRPFALLLYAYKLTGNKTYYDAAKRCADVSIQFQHPETGSCPDYVDFDQINPNLPVTKANLEKFNRSYNDYATTDPMRMTIIMYHLTGDGRYLKRTAKIGQWMFETLMRQGPVRGWCQQYDNHNEPIRSRPFEGAVISPRVFNRFTSPMLTWFYTATGNDRYLNLLQETYNWMRSVEKPGGWSYQYLPDGTEVFTWKETVYRYDKPDTWHKKMQRSEYEGENTDEIWGKYRRNKVQLDDTDKILNVLNTGGLAALKNWYIGPTKFSPPQYLKTRLAAARRVTDENFEVILEGGKESLGINGSIKGKFLKRVRKRWARPFAFSLPRQCNGKIGLFRQTWPPMHDTIGPYRPPIGWAQWQYVWDVKLALGLIEPDKAATGGRGLQAMHYYEPWDVMGDWTTRAIEVEDWLNIPLAEYE